MDEIESRRAQAEAGRPMADNLGAPGPHEDMLLRYLGAVYYDTRRGRASKADLERAVADLDEHVRRNGSAAGPS